MAEFDYIHFRYFSLMSEYDTCLSNVHDCQDFWTFSSHFISEHLTDILMTSILTPGKKCLHNIIVGLNGFFV